LDTNQFKVIKFTKILINDGIYRLTNISTAPFKFLPIINDKIKETTFAVKQNKALKAELKKFQNKEYQVEFLKNQNDNLRRILDSDIKIKGESILAKVLLDKDSPYLKSIVINRGSKSGISKGMPVVDGNFLVGKIVEVNYLSSRVLLLNDLNSRIPITFGKESIQAILSGKGESQPVLEYLPDLYEPYGNQTVFTSGKDGIFLPGIPVGKTEMDELNVKVRLFSDPNQLSFVTVQLLNLNRDNF
jgi:rod shape-determining protein MreC